VFVVSVLRFVKDVFRFIDDDNPFGIGKSTLGIIVFDSLICAIARSTSDFVEIASMLVENSLSVRVGTSTSRTGVVERRSLIIESSISA
jgi:hypothetical protein